jgi:hypothetical protein
MRFEACLVLGVKYHVKFPPPYHLKLPPRVSFVCWGSARGIVFPLAAPCEKPRSSCVGLGLEFRFEQSGLELLFEPEAFTFDIHGRNAKLIFRVEIGLDAGSAALYARPERRICGRRRAPLKAIVFSNESRNV